MWQTKLTEKVGIQFPIIQAPMAGGATTPELIAAVSNAGGLGSLGAGYMTPAEIKEAIIKIRQLTSKPFAVNLFIPEEHSASTDQMQIACDDINQCCHELNIKIEPIAGPYAQPFEEQLNVLVEEKIPVFSYTFGNLNPAWINQLQTNQTILIGTATNLMEAKILEESGIDFVVAQGGEAGGHRGTFIGQEEDSLMSLNNLLLQLTSEIKTPIIAAGGIMAGADIIAAMDLGTAGVQMGSAFLTCFESGIPNIYKQALLTQQRDNTIFTRAFSGKLARGIHNKFTDRMNNRKVHILDYPIQNVLTSSMRKKAKERNDPNFMSMWAGQFAYQCRNMSAEELLRALVIEIEAGKADL